MSQTYPQFATREELAHLLAGGDDYIRTKNNEVRGLVLRRDMNPDLPEAVAFGKGPRVEARARLLLDSRKVVPVYVKRRVGEWEYIGLFRASRIKNDDATILRYGSHRPIVGVLFLEHIDETRVEVFGGSFPDPETRREIERAAVEHATDTLESERFTVHDHQKKNLGYDLLAEKESERIYVEVKGTDRPEPHFHISRNERLFARENADWHLFVVCEARQRPTLYRFSSSEMDQRFNFEALAWECRRVDT
jgi:hypothetical protein